MVQVASPYEVVAPRSDGDEWDDEETRMAQALDVWVDRLVKMYPEQKATWSQPLPTVAKDGEVSEADSETKPVINLLKRILYRQGDGDRNEIAGWDDTAVLIKFVKDALGKESGLDPEFFGTTPQEIIDAAAGYFPEIAGNGAEEAEEVPEK